MEDIDFWMDFVAGNSNKLQILGLEGIISWALNVFTLGPMTQPTLCIGYNSESLGQGYLYIKEGGLFVCVVWLRSLKWWDPLSCSWYLVLLEIPWAGGCIEVPIW